MAACQKIIIKIRELIKMIYVNHLGRPDPIAVISKFGGSSVYPGQIGGQMVLKSTAKNAPDKRWDYTSKDMSSIVREMKQDGWTCEVKKDGYNHPVIWCVHKETRAALDRLEATKVKLIGKGQAGYIRFGDLPETGKSTNKVTGDVEPGVSVYRATFYKNGYRVETPWYSQGTYISISQRQAYQVWGELVGNGSDGEPCLKVTRKKKLS